MKKTDLLDVLKIIMPGIGGTNILLEGADSFIFDTDWIKTFNDEISISFPFKTGLRCLVKAQEMYQVLSKIESDEISIQVLDGNKFQLSGGKTVLKMSSTSDISGLSSLVDNLSLEDVKWKNLPEDFLQALNTCSKFASRNPAFQALCSVSVGRDGVIASDREKAGYYQVQVQTDEEFILRTESVRELIKFTNITQFSISESWIHFKGSNGGYFSIRKYSSEFPRDDIKNLMVFDDLGRGYRFPKDLEKTIDRVSVLVSMTKDGDEYISLSLDKNDDLIIKGAREIGEITEKISKDGDWSFPKNIIIQINPDWLLSLLSIGREFFIKDQQFLLMRNGNLKSIAALVNEESNV